MEAGAPRELFELTLTGGPAEALYRRARPEVERLPWGKALGVRVTSAQRMAARQQWTIAALQEYQSASAQAAVLAALVRARVPLDLSAMAARFPIDELTHAEVCARMANELGGGTPVSYDAEQVFRAPPPTKRRPLLEATILVARLFGVAEGWSYGFIHGLLAEARVPLLRAVWRALLRDEAMHARFAWMFLSWARAELTADEWSEVQSGVRASVATMVGSWQSTATLAPEAFSCVSPLGVGDRETYRRRAELALSKFVVARFQRVGISTT